MSRSVRYEVHERTHYRPGTDAEEWQWMPLLSGLRSLRIARAELRKAKANGAECRLVRLTIEREVMR